MIASAVAVFLMLVLQLSGDMPPGGFRVGGVITNYAPGRAIHVALYSSEKAFAQQQYYMKLRFRPDQLAADSIRYVFEGVREGEYCVAAFQDMNGDHDFNKGLFGRPVEPYCLYRPHEGIFAPKFSKCKFRVDRDIHDADLFF